MWVSTQSLLLFKQTTQFFPAFMDYSGTWILSFGGFQKRSNSLVGRPVFSHHLPTHPSSPEKMDLGCPELGEVQSLKPDEKGGR